MCGDYFIQPLFLHRVFDTTPRVRGLQKKLFTLFTNSRYNPACAGTTASCACWRLTGTIQPRVCGDYDASSNRVPLSADTTPRVRGLLGVVKVVLDRYRYNPACAGTTTANRKVSYRRSIQPRVCGDYNWPYPRFLRHADTTPRVRGLRRSSVIMLLTPRYNPACAGTTRRKGTATHRWPIQPRVCGDYL